jgi:UDP-glucose 4-epimerase
VKNILITGASGYLGSLLVKKLSENKSSLGIEKIIAMDIRPLREQIDTVITEIMDIRDDRIEQKLNEHQIHCVVHLASIVTPGKKSDREFEYSVDVLGTKNILKASVASGVKRIIISSSGAAYGYHPENINVLKEDDPIRGNYEFAYSYHKKLVEEELALYRDNHPQLEQTIFRITTILGDQVNNQITDLFKKPIQIGIMGTESRFSFIWDQDAVDCFMQSIFSSKTGIYNLSGDGSVSIRERGKILKKPVVFIPAKLIEGALFILKKLGLTQYGPEQTLFLKYRPVLDNSRLKTDFGFTPRKTSLEVFNYFVERL